MGWTGRTLIGGVAAMLAAALLVVLLVRPSGSHRHRAAPARTAAPSPQRHVVVKAPPRRPPARPRKVRPKPAPPVRRVRLPLASARVKPWRRDGTSFVASGRHDWLAVYARPHVQRPSLILRNPDRIGSPRALLVHSKRRHWVRVFLPRRPNGITGWIQRKAVRVLRNPYRIEIRLRAHRLRLWKGKRIVVRAKTVVGKPSTPT